MIDLDKIHRGMNILTSDGQKIGTVRELVGQVMFLDDAASAVHPSATSVPLTWIVAVDEAVHLAKSREQAEHEWRTEPQEKR